MQSEQRAEQKLCPTYLIRDQVATEDEFRHEVVATSIADMILSDSGGCAIALTGSWGSGKSTVVRLLADELARRGEVQTFVFDAWAHQGDPLRRTFLEKLIQWCNEETREWTKNKAHWNKRIDELAKRSETVQTKSAPRLTRWGMAGALALLITPIALQIYQKISYSSHPVWEWVAIIASGLPIFVAAFLLLDWYISQHGKPPDRRQPIPNLLFTSSENNITSTSSKTPDPTSVEFEQTYRELLGEALEDKKRQIVLVIDNLDRVNHSDARSIWATLRVFFESSLDGTLDWRKRVWVLVPFDPDAIRDLWDGSADKAALSSNSQHFLEKTFQATFRVPPIILSNRREYLTKQLRAAFPNHTDSDFYAIFRLFDRLNHTSGEDSTPRNLKQFVNSIGALHRQWQDQIPLVEQAAFVLSSGQMRALLSTAGTTQLLPNLPSTISMLLGKDWPRNFAAMYYNVEPEEAYQVLLSPHINRALQKGDRERLAGLEHNPGFAEAMARAVENVCGATGAVDSDNLAHAATAFSAVGTAWTGHETCKKQFHLAALSVSQWEPFTAEVATGIVHILELAPDGYDIPQIVGSVRDSLEKQGKKDSDLEELCEALAIVLPPLSRRNRDALSRNFRIPGSAEKYLDMIDTARKHEGLVAVWEHLRPLEPPAAIVANLAGVAQTGKWDPEKAHLFESISSVDAQWDWDPLITALTARLNGTYTALPSDFTAIVDTLFLLAKNNAKAKAFFIQSAGQDTQFQHLRHLLQNKQFEAAAPYVLSLLTADVPLQTMSQQPIHYQQQNQNQIFAREGRQQAVTFVQSPESFKDLVTAAAQRLLEWASAERWQEISESKSDRRGVVTVLLRQALQQSDGSDIPTTQIVDHFDFWQSVLGDQFLDHIVESRSKTGELTSALMQHPFDLNQQHLYLVALKDHLLPEYGQFLRDSLKECNEEDWHAALENETDLLTLALRLKSSGLRLGQPFQDALIAHANERLTVDHDGLLAPRWSEIVELLDPEYMEIFRDRLLTIFNSLAGSIRGLLPYYGNMLFNMVSDSGPKQSIARLIQIIESHDPDELRWFIEVVEAWRIRGRQIKSYRRDWLERAEASIAGKVNKKEQDALKGLISALQSTDRS